jgi:hypothetical protein
MRLLCCLFVCFSRRNQPNNLKEWTLALVERKAMTIVVTGCCKHRGGQAMRSKIQLQESAEESFDGLCIPVCRPGAHKKHFDTLQVRPVKAGSVTLESPCHWCDSLASFVSKVYRLNSRRVQVLMEVNIMVRNFWKMMCSSGNSC